MQHTAYQGRGGAPCYRQQRVDGRACGRVGRCATTGERRYASELPRARIFCDDERDNVRGSCITQVPTVELKGSVSISDMSHEPVGFLSGLFKGSQQRWGNVGKEGFAIVSTFKWLP